MIRLATTTSPVDLAWAAFDAAALRFHYMYRHIDLTTDTPADSAARQRLAGETARLWDEWRKLFLGDDPGDAA
ncbi:hypothetical protein [Sphingomonas sp. Leaf242]|uniref:hypothetical protein n=1 Tax=Sphingomonas sp. Leaf242 TaxID=1736304 RepID=UPI00071425D8|nr:hypothetical protein [Sphingomonas sp. Leaf242]KQO13256.1 hypothetical protein ASF09_03130 [Sphingomonas sp. Leaf242]